LTWERVVEHLQSDREAIGTGGNYQWRRYWSTDLLLALVTAGDNATAANLEEVLGMSGDVLRAEKRV
jgi:hypothetical protein